MISVNKISFFMNRAIKVAGAAVQRNILLYRNKSAVVNGVIGTGHVHNSQTYQSSLLKNNGKARPWNAITRSV